ncbi:MAG: amidohydrolase family protein [Pseudomonadota bacterium]
MLSQIKTVLTIILVVLIGVKSPAASEQAPATYIHAGVLIDVKAQEAKSDQTIVVSGGMIVDVADGFIKAPEGSKTINLKDATVLPGLIDAHVHLLISIGPDTQLKFLTQNDSEATLDGVVNAHATLMAGFTTVQDLGGRSEAIFALRDAIAKGQVPGPRVLASGDIISPNASETMISCSGVDECRRVTRAHIIAGADVIKSQVTGDSVLSIGAPPARFTAEELRAIVETAQSMGRKTVIHAHGTDSINFALRQKVHSIEHGTYINNESVRLFRKTGAVLVPTLLAGQVVEGFAANPMAPPAYRSEASQFTSRMIAATARAHKGGVKIAFGSDAGAPPHGLNAQEFSLMVKAGLTPMEALRSATIIAAEHLGVENTTGVIEQGKAADIIAVRNRNPLEDVSVLEAIDFVMKNGVVYKGGDE